MKNEIRKALFRRPEKGRPKKKKAPSPAKPDKVYYNPSEDMSRGTRLVGLAMRTLVLYVGVLGLTAFICGAAGLSAEVYWQACRVSGGYIALVSLAVAAAAAVASLGHGAAFAVPVLYCGAYLGITAAMYGNPFAFAAESAVRVYNYALYTVSSRGFYSLGNYMAADGYDYANAGYAVSDPQRFAGVFLLASLIGFVLFWCIQKKTRIVPLAIFITAVIAPVMTYNIADSNIGTGFTFVFIIGAVALKVYDYRYAGSMEKKLARRSARRMKKAERLKKRAAARTERAALKAEADRMFTAALEADMGMKRSKLAKKAVYKARRESKKKQRLAAIAAERQKKADIKNARSAEKKAKRENKKKIAELRRMGNIDEADKLRDEADRETNALRRAARSEKESLRSAARAAKREDARRRRNISFAGGFAGFGAAACAMLAVWIPMTAVSENFPVIDSINNRVQIVRTYVTAYLTGNDVDLNDIDAYGIDELAPRTLTFDELVYDDKRVLKVETTGKSNVYLRSWIGTDFDYASDSWTSADHDTVLAYRERFGTDFSPDEITFDFNKYVYPSSTDITDKNTYKNFSKYGFTVQQVNIWRFSGSSRILFVPSFMNTDRGIMKYNSIDEPEYKYSRYFDGVYSSRFYKYGTGYSTISAVTAMNRDAVGESIENSIEYFNMNYNAIRNSVDSDGMDADIDTYTLENSLSELGIEYTGTTIAERFNNMTEDEKTAYLDSVEKEKDYRSYAASAYTGTTGSEAVASLADSISANAEDINGDGKISRYENVMAVVSYFRDDYTYTLSPDSSNYSGEGSVLEAFLLDVKQGYCTHFATAACELLREENIPARYVEGYVASDFEKAVGGSTAPYRSVVTDKSAHSWVEVYFDSVGWVQFEVTPGDYMSDMYDADSATIVPNDSISSPDTPDGGSPEADMPEKNQSTVEDIPEEVSQLALLIRIVAVVVAVGALVAAVYFTAKRLSKKAHDMMSERYRVIDRAKNQDAYNDPKTDKHWLARQLDDWIMDIFKMIGCQPEKGELPLEFTARMRRDYGGLSKIDIALVVEAMEKEEFGHGLSLEEMTYLASYLEDIIASVYAGLSPVQKLRIRYIKRRI